MEEAEKKVLRISVVSIIAGIIFILGNSVFNDWLFSSTCCLTGFTLTVLGVYGLYGLL